ncbi:MAG TPA: phosphoribosylanthranilate isomerase [Firmicutes bacterium]|nr:phosphoribosylanthranilate isomerase [Bacillota bacterium]
MWVKVCGLSDLEAVNAAIEAGADAAGFVMVPGSRRYTGPALARQLAAAIPERMWKVGVFRDQDYHEIATIMRQSGLDTVQLHDYGDLDLCRRLQDAGWRVIRAFGLRPKGSAPGGTGLRGANPGEADLRPFACAGVTILLDAWQPGGSGGLGVTTDWCRARELVDRLPGARVILAGGLNPENLPDAIKAVRPWGVDASSGLERYGRKDPSLIKAFVGMCKTGTCGQNARKV